MMIKIELPDFSEAIALADPHVITVRQEGLCISFHFFIFYYFYPLLSFHIISIFVSLSALFSDGYLVGATSTTPLGSYKCLARSFQQ